MNLKELRNFWEKQYIPLITVSHPQNSLARSTVYVLLVKDQGVGTRKYVVHRYFQVDNHWEIGIGFAGTKSGLFDAGKIITKAFADLYPKDDKYEVSSYV